jgi:hypothetical protein
MLHKHPSAEKAQSYFGITEKLKHDAANFFIYIQPKLSYIYDNSIVRALGDHFNSKEVRDKHVAHLSTLLTGGIDQRFINESHQIRKKYAKLDVTTGEYIKLYQLIISYLSGEAHKKHWWRYKKYRDLNRSIRNLVLFDLAIGTSPRELDATLHELGTAHSLHTSQLTKTISAEVQQAVTELTMLTEKSYHTLNECYNALQSALDTNEPVPLTADTLKVEVNTPTAQASLFEVEIITDDIKALSHENKPAFMKILSCTRKKIYKASQLITIAANDPQSLEKVLNEIQEDIDKLSQFTSIKPSIYEDSKNQNAALHTLLKKSKQAIQSNLNNLEELKENQSYIK